MRNDLLGFTMNIPIKKMSSKVFKGCVNVGLERYGVDPAELQQALDSLAYLILHIAKVKANEQEFDIIYD